MKSAVMKIDGETKILGLIGQNISYSMSPAMHNRFFTSAKINAVYLPFDIPADACAPLLESMFAAGAIGFNVTQPHKSFVGVLVDNPAGLSSSNTLVRNSVRYKAHSTDGVGFVNGLTRICQGIDQFEQIVLLGSGGASIALLEHLNGLDLINLKSLDVVRRSSARDEELRGIYSRSLQIHDLSVENLSKLLKGRREETLLVQATSAPLRGDRLESLVPALQDFKGVLSDLVYGRPSALYDAAIAMDLHAQDGEAMLIEQARQSQRLWFGKAAAYADMAAALRGK